MALGTYLQLKSSIASWMHRSDLTSVIPDFVALAESAIRRDLRCRAMVTTQTGTLSATTLAVPTRFAAVKRILLDGYEVNYVTPAAWAVQDSNSGGSSYTIIGDNFAFQSSSATYTLEYYAWFAAFTDDADTNWLLTYHPGVYLFAALAEAMIYIQGDPTIHLAKYQSALQRVRAADNNFGGPVRVAVRPEAVV